MKYIVILSSFTEGSGHNYTTEYETGSCDEPFSAESYAKDEGFDGETEDGEWFEVKIKFYANDADPMFDDPLSVSVYNETLR